MILDIKQRHADFFEDETRRRLEESPRAAKLTRSSLRKAAWPIGAVDRSAADRDVFEQYVFGGEAGAASAAAIEAQVAALPGLDRSIGEAIARKLLP
jgi:hypothetical protein